MIVGAAVIVRSAPAVAAEWLACRRRQRDRLLAVVSPGQATLLPSDSTVIADLRADRRVGLVLPAIFPA